jgi:hypothetical protein
MKQYLVHENSEQRDDSEEAEEPEKQIPCHRFRRRRRVVAAGGGVREPPGSGESAFVRRAANQHR